MFIVGTQPRRKTVGKGEFYCPHCQAQRNYERKTVQQHLSLYFIPVIPIGDKQEVIECMTCHMQFAPDVLDVQVVKKQKPLTLAEMINRLEDILRGGKPIEYAVRDLVMAGLERDAAWKLVKTTLADAIQTCPNCQLSYADNLTVCPECQQPLNTN